MTDLYIPCHIDLSLPCCSLPGRVLTCLGVLVALHDQRIPGRGLVTHPLLLAPEGRHCQLLGSCRCLPSGLGCLKGCT